MKGLAAQQAPDGMWRQVVDEPGSYREFTVTAMVSRPSLGVCGLAGSSPASSGRWPIAPGAVSSARIAEDGTLLDVCTGTGRARRRSTTLRARGYPDRTIAAAPWASTAAIEMEMLRGRSR